MSDWQWETGPSSLAADEADWWQRWDALNASGCASHPLLESTFAAASIKYLAMGKVLRLTGKDRQGDAIMALVCPTSMMAWSVFQPSQAPIPFIVFRSDLRRANLAVSCLLEGRSPLPAVLRLSRVDDHFLPTNASGKGTKIDRAAVGKTIAVETADFEDYWNTRALSLRKNIRRSVRRLEDADLPWRLEKVSDPVAIAAAVDQYGLLESAGWKGREGTALHPDNKQGHFYRDLLGRYARRGDGHVFRLWIGDRIAAIRLVIAGHGMAVILKTTYDETLSAFAPGRLLLQLVLKSLIDDPSCRRIEFYTNANEETLAWGTEWRDMYGVTCYRWSMAKAAMDIARRVRNHGRKLLAPIPGP
jgi:hypothetical protein